MRLTTSIRETRQDTESTANATSWNISLITAVILLLCIIPQFFTWAPDDIYMATLANPDKFAESAFMLASRPLGAALFGGAEFLHLNVITDCYLFAAVYALAFAWFFLTAISWISDWNPSPLTVGAGASLVCLYGFQIDFNQFKHQYVVVGLMYLLMAAYLLVFSKSKQRSTRLLLFVVIGFLANLCYQAATMAIAMLLAGRMLKLTVESRRCTRNAPGELARIVDGFAGIVLSCILYYVLTKVMYRLGVPTLRPPVPATLGWLGQRTHDYFDAVVALLTPVGGSYGAQNDLGCVIWSLIAIPLLVKTWATKRFGSFAMAAGLVALIVVLAQNPENLFLQTYWPAPRASFYASFVSPILLVAAFSSFGGRAAADRMARKFLGWVTLFAILLEASATSHVIIDHIETYTKDMALAREISLKISDDPALAALTQIRFPSSSWDPRNAYFLGLEPPSYDYGSLFAAPWSANALIEMASGLKLTVAGTSVCPAEPRTTATLTVKRQGKSIAVCF